MSKPNTGRKPLVLLAKPELAESETSTSASRFPITRDFGLDKDALKHLEPRIRTPNDHKTGGGLDDEGPPDYTRAQEEAGRREDPPPGTPKPPEPLHYADWLAIDDMPKPTRPRYLINGLIRPHTLCMIAAFEGVGKSYIRRQVGIQLALGLEDGRLFDHFDIVHRAIFMVADAENGPEEEWEAEEAILEGLDSSRADLEGRYLRADYANFHLDDPKHQAHIIEKLDAQHAKHPAEHIVLALDHITIMVTATWGEKLTPAVDFLLSLLHDREWLTILVLAHTKKPNRDNGASPSGQLDEVLGNLTRSCASVLIFTDIGDQRLRLQTHKRVPKQAVVLMAEDGLWRYVADATGTDVMTLDPKDQEAINYVHAQQAVTAPQVAIHLKETPQTAGRRLRKLVAQGRLDRFQKDNVRPYWYIRKEPGNERT